MVYIIIFQCCKGYINDAEENEVSMRESSPWS